ATSNRRSKEHNFSANTSICLDGQDVLISGMPKDVAFCPMDGYASEHLLAEEETVVVNFAKIILLKNQH
ncbi:hypothetical protein KS419_04230, partial [Bacillus tamaricis]